MPIALGYLPAAFAFGAAATGIGLGVAEVGAMSAIVFSGANQAFLLAAILFSFFGLQRRRWQQGND